MLPAAGSLDEREGEFEKASRVFATQLTSVRGVRSSGLSAGSSYNGRTVRRWSDRVPSTSDRTHALDLIVRRLVALAIPHDFARTRIDVRTHVEDAEEDAIDAQEEALQHKD